MSGGLVDPTLLGALRRAGYSESRAHIRPPSLSRGLGSAPPRRPARPDPAARWRAVVVDDRAGAIRRTPGLELDLGGSVKGWAADLLAARLELYGRCAVDCGGDLRVAAGSGAPWEVRVRHPLTGAVAHTLRVRAGGVATSGIDARLWEREDGDFAHHLIDPATGVPAWTGSGRGHRACPDRTGGRGAGQGRSAVRSGGGTAAAARPPRRRARPRRWHGRPCHLSAQGGRRATVLGDPVELPSTPVGVACLRAAR